MTAAYNVIDAVRALRALFPAVSSKWLAFGISQGGQAAWAANELDSAYGNGLSLAGAVAAAPATNLSGASGLALNRLLSPEQIAFVPMVITGLERIDRTFGQGQFLRGIAAEDQAELIGCGSDVNSLRALVTVDDVRPRNSSDAEILRTALRRIALPQRALSRPMLVINGLKDETVLPAWTSTAVNESCAMGGQIEHIEIPDAGHTLPVDSEIIGSWIDDRFAGKLPVTNCPIG